ncbi:MAG: SRPBCC domain-containing protein [Pseudomonadota bacterium]
MADDQITRGSADLVKTIFLAAPPERVWAFLTEKRYLDRWYNTAEADLAPDAPYTLTKDGKPLVWGRVLRWDPPRELVTTFEVAPLDGAKTTVTWILEEAPGGTRVTLHHAGILAAGAVGAQMLAALDPGWDTHFVALRAVAGD